MTTIVPIETAELEKTTSDETLQSPVRCSVAPSNRSLSVNFVLGPVGGSGQVVVGADVFVDVRQGSIVPVGENPPEDGGGGRVFVRTEQEGADAVVAVGERQRVGHRAGGRQFDSLGLRRPGGEGFAVVVAALREVDRRGVVARILRGRHGDGHASVVDLPDRQVPEPPARERLHRKRRGAVLVVDVLEVFVERGLRENLVVVTDEWGGRVGEEPIRIRGDGCLVRELRRAGGAVDEVQVASGVLIETMEITGVGIDDRRVGDRQRRVVLRGDEIAAHRSSVDDRVFDAVVAELDFAVVERQRGSVPQRQAVGDSLISRLCYGHAVDDDVIRLRGDAGQIPVARCCVVGCSGIARPRDGVGVREGAEQYCRERREDFRFHGVEFFAGERRGGRRYGAHLTRMLRGMQAFSGMQLV